MCDLHPETTTKKKKMKEKNREREKKKKKKTMMMMMMMMRTGRSSRTRALKRGCRLTGRGIRRGR